MELLKKTAAFRIDKQTNGKSNDEVFDIALNGVPFIPELITSFVNLRHLSLISMKPQLTSLASVLLSSFNQLRVLDVSDNVIRVTEPVPSCPSLQRLFIANNKIESLREIELIAQSCPALVVLDVLNNPVDTDDKFNSIFSLFPQLEVLNGKTENGSDVSVRDSDESDSSEDEDDEEEDEDDEEEEDEEEEEEEEENAKSDNESTDSEPETKRARKE